MMFKVQTSNTTTLDEDHHKKQAIYILNEKKLYIKLITFNRHLIKFRKDLI